MENPGRSDFVARKVKKLQVHVAQDVNEVILVHFLFVVALDAFKSETGEVVERGNGLELGD